MQEVGFDGGKLGLRAQRAEQRAPHRDDELGAARRTVEAAQQFLPRRLGGRAQLRSGASAFGSAA